MKKVGFMIVYNDADYIDFAINSVKNWFDEFVIIEGAFEITMKCGMPPRSNDGTLDIIWKYVDNKKIFLKQANLREHKLHYQIGLDFAKERSADWAIMVDSDEIWTEAAKKLVDAKLKTADKIGAYEFRIKEYCFVNDFNTWYPGEYPRIFKVTPEAYFVADNEVAWPDHGKHEDRGRAQNHIHLLSPTMKIFHYGYVRRKKRWRLKQDYMYEKDGNPVNLQHKLEGNTYILPSDIPVYKFDGNHPECMKTHPFYGKTANEIIYGE